jgi:hypothetical protein
LAVLVPLILVVNDGEVGGGTGVRAVNRGLAGGWPMRLEEGVIEGVATGGAMGGAAPVPSTGGRAEEIGEVPYPRTEIFRRGAGGVVPRRIVEETKDLCCEIVCDGFGHSGKALHEELDGLLAIEVKGGTLGGI